MAAGFGRSGGAMLRLAFGYLAVAIVVAIGFSSLPDSEPNERRVAKAARHGTQSERTVPAYADEADGSAWEGDAWQYDESGWQDDESGWQDDESGWQDDENAWEDGGYSDDEGQSEENDLEYVIESGAGGHFVVEAVVNGAPVTFLVDTGASNVVLTMADAERLGFRPETLRFTERFASANGEVRAAPVVLRELRIGQFSVFDMPASVNEAPLRVSLLGMSFLRRLHGYGVEDGRLILRW
jgi:clan AA aspartic protease (TIGR02281 family)